MSSSSPSIPAADTMAASGVRSSWATSEVKRRSRSRLSDRAWIRVRASMFPNAADATTASAHHRDRTAANSHSPCRRAASEKKKNTFTPAVGVPPRRR